MYKKTVSSMNSATHKILWTNILVIGSYSKTPQSDFN